MRNALACSSPFASFRLQAQCTRLKSSSTRPTCGPFRKGSITTILYDAIFGCCASYPGTDRTKLGAWFRDYEITPNLRFAARSASRREIEQAFDRTERLRVLMTTSASLAPAELRAAFKAALQ